jgi:hypothetical protein
MRDEFFLRVSIDKEARTALIETLIETPLGTNTWYKREIRGGIDPENFDYTVIEDAKRVLKNDTGPYQYYWVTTDRATWEEAEVNHVKAR